MELPFPKGERSPPKTRDIPYARGHWSATGTGRGIPVDPRVPVGSTGAQLHALCWSKWLKMAQNEPKMPQNSLRCLKIRQIDISPNARTVALVPLVYHGRAQSYEPLCTPFRSCMPPRTRLVCPRRGPNGSPQSPKTAVYWLKVGPKWSQYRSTLRKTVQNGSTRDKIGPQVAGWVPRWY